MAFEKVKSRQTVQSVVKRVKQTELTPFSPVTFCEVPEGAVVTRVATVVDVPFDSSTSDTFWMGFGGPNDTPDTVYYSSSLDVDGVAGTVSTAPQKGRIAVSEETISLLLFSIGDPGTAGEVIVSVDYVVPGRVVDNYGYG